MNATVKNSKMARRYGEEFKRQAVELMSHVVKRKNHFFERKSKRYPLRGRWSEPSEQTE